MEYQSLTANILLAKKKLKEKDYIGRKIAEVMMYGTQEEIEAIKLEYASDVEEAKQLRQQINEWEAQLKGI